MREASFQNAGIAFRPVGAVHGVELSATIADMDLQPVAVVLQLMRPAMSPRGLLGHNWLAWMNEGGGRI